MGKGIGGLQLSQTSLMAPPMAEPSVVDPKEQARQDKNLVEHCTKLYTAAKDAHPTKDFETFNNYYLGKFNDKDNPNLSNNFNIIKAIIETKTTLALDSKITTSVVPKIGALADLAKIEAIDKVADIIHECLDYTKRCNKFDSLQEKYLRRAEKLGIGIGKVVWDQTLSNGLGDVSITEVNPQDFFPDPSANNIADCNYIVLKTHYSVITLKRKYPDRLDEIDKLSKKSTSEKKNSPEQTNAKVLTVQTAEQTTQVYNSDTKGFDYLTQNIVVYECYLKDDTTFIPQKDASQSEIQDKAQIGFKYPNGRVIIYAGDTENPVVFEDKPIDVSSSFPFVKINLIETDDMWGQGEIQDLINIQNRINMAYFRLRSLIAKYVSIIMIDENCGITENEIVNQFVITLDPGILNTGRQPAVLTNNTLSEIQNILNYIETLKKEAKELARVNDMMISGLKERGVNSGQMVQDLNESPLTSIRAIQKALYQFQIDISNKAILLMQKYFNTPRIVRIAEGKDFYSIGNGPEIEKYSVNPNKTIDNPNQFLIDKIKGDLSITEYECQVVEGAELPRSRGAQANIVMQLADKGYFDDRTDLISKKIMFRAMDLPNRRAIEKTFEDKEARRAQAPSPVPPIEKITVSFDQLPPISQMEVLKLNGLIPNQTQSPASDQNTQTPQAIAA